MKKISKYIITFMLAVFAKAVVRRYAPRVVMITGSVGKTSTKDAIAAVLKTRFFVRASEKSFNSEFGVPFTILGVANPWDNPLSWLKVVRSTLALLLLPNHYPNMLVLEVGADKPGDLARILRIATPDAVVVTRLPEIPVHVEAYASPEAVREEEFSPAYALRAAAPLIVSADDLYAFERAHHTSARVITYGCSAAAQVNVCNIDFYEEEGKVRGMKAAVSMDGEESSCVVKGSVGRAQLLPVAAALAAAQAFRIPLAEAVASLESYEPPPGRGRLLAGKNGSIIIDDSYNASPAAMEEALATLKSFPHAKRRVAVLGDMLELGRYSVMEHRRIAALAAESADVIATVGIRARAFTLDSKQVSVLSFDCSRSGALGLSDIIRDGDVVLVKGSQSVRTEHIVKALLADPADASRLVRQEKKWEEKV
ncbi:MAG: UDP-N-acetylmuramoyl-tripeptide--D-alanyl-D-alanine ligase [Candidatus Pacebacteria bacterium]|nr:UDP-N-acetylmuramoyl-tripeptide--D-alanyl-D-alanine ligase [Candidatus Paceibacterota bacterium]